ncbi:MFS transporter [Phenylobacterium aquaticum]|uniref:AmpG family muropeptide MFS transporter n=1 Tax=Phenylobacterium aquaticum TaxID=1763816 RepID=UPI0026EAFCA2|nr:MFS transporter [Phenylobacterium aquaticum]
MTDTPAPKRRRTAVEVLAALRQPKIAVMLALGFSSGLPFLLTGNTFGYWLREEGTTLKAIGFLSWVGLAYSMKLFWAPLIDRLDAPILGKWLGRRRGWMVLSQLAVGAGLVGMALTGPRAGLTTVGMFAVIVAFASATQDIVIDAWRIEAADDEEELGLLSSAFQLGYRAALLATDALILVVAARVGWANSYIAAGLCMAVGLFATLKAFEPTRADTILKSKAPLWTPRGFFDAVVGPFIDFFATHKELGLLMLVAVALYRIPDFVMGPMANPYYHDLGITKDMVATVRGSIGLVAALAGIAAGGVSAIRLGFFPTLIIGAILQPLAVAAFALLSLTGANLGVFSAVMAGDNFAMSFAGVALVAYMSSLTGLGYTATQYALLSSTYAMLGKFLKGFSGEVVEGLTPAHGLLGAYAVFFVGAGLIGLPALVMFVVLARAHARREARLAAEAAPAA